MSKGDNSSPRHKHTRCSCSCECKGVWRVFPVILLMALAIAMVIPVLPDLVNSFYHTTVLPPKKKPEPPAFTIGLLFALHATCEFLAAPTLGRLSDYYGRRPIILLALCGESIDVFIMAVAPQLWMFFVGRVIAGSTNGIFGAISAMLADLSESVEDRANNFALIGLAFGVSFILGPGIGGVLSLVDVRLPLLAALSLTAINALYVAVWLPESFTGKPRESEFSSWNPCLPLKPFVTDWYLGGLALYVLLFGMAFNGLFTMFTLFTETKFGWTPVYVGAFFSVFGATTAVVQGVAIRFLVPDLLSERKAAVGGTSIMCLATLFFAFSTQGWQCYAAILPFCLGYVAAPTVQSLISRCASAQDQGRLQGAYQAVNTLTRVLGPLVASGVMDTWDSFDGAAFVVALCFFACGVVVLCLTFWKYPVSPCFDGAHTAGAAAAGGGSSSSSSRRRAEGGGDAAGDDDGMRLTAVPTSKKSISTGFGDDDDDIATEESRGIQLSSRAASEPYAFSRVESPPRSP